MSIIRSWAGNGLVAGAASTTSIGVGDNAFTTVTAGITISSDGTRAPQITYPDTAGAHQVRWNALGNLSTWAVRRYITFGALPAASAGIFTGYDTGGISNFRIEINTTGLLRLRNNTSATWSQISTALSPGTRYRIEVVGGSGSATVYVFEGESETVLISGAGTIENTTLDEVRFGRHLSVAWTGEKGDDFAIANTASLIGAVDPIDPNPPVTGVIRKWSGDGLSTGAASTGSVGAGDTAFTTVTAGMTIATGGLRTPRIAWPLTAGAHQVRWNALGNLSTWAVRRYFSVASVPTSAWQLMQGLSSTGSELWRIEFSTSGLLRLRNASGATYSATTAPLEAGVVYRCEIIGNSTTGSATVYLYHADYSTVLVSGTGTVETAFVDEVRFGHTTSVAITDETGDDFAVSNLAVLIGAVDPQGSEPSATVVKKWAGDGLSAGSLTTGSAGTGDVPFNTVTGALTIIASGKRSPQILLPDTAGIKRVHWWPIASSALTTYAVRWYMTFGGYSPAEIYLANGRATSDKWSVRLTTAGYLRLRDDEAATVRWTGSQALPLNTSIRLELIVNGSSASLKAYRGDHDIVIDSGSGVVGSIIDEVRFGFSSSVASTSITYDDLRISDQAVTTGPAAQPGSPKTHFLYTSSGWVAQEVTLL